MIIMPTLNQIQVLTKLIENLFCVDNVVLTEKSTLNDFHSDELDAVEFIMAFEEEFRIDLERFNESLLDEIHRVPLFEFFQQK